MTNPPLWQSLVERGRAGIEALSSGWFRDTPAEIARQRLKADAIPRESSWDAAPDQP